MGNGMKPDSDTIHFIIEVTEDDTAEVLNVLLEKAGLVSDGMSSSDDLANTVKDNPCVILQLPKKSDWKRLKELVESTSVDQPAVSFSVITSHSLLLMKKSLKNPLLHVSEKNRNHKTLGEIEKEHIIQTLSSFGWKYKTAAKFLGIDRSTLYRKLKKYGIKE